MRLADVVKQKFGFSELGLRGAGEFVGVVAQGEGHVTLLNLSRRGKLVHLNVNIIVFTRGSLCVFARAPCDL